MNRDGSRVFFTDEDKKHMIVKMYTKSEVENTKKEYKTERNIRRIVLILFLFVLIVLSYLFVQLQFAIYIAIVFMIFLILLYEVIDRINLKALSRSFYVESDVEKSLPIETRIEGTLTPGSDVSSFYPVEGRDTTSGYKSIYYIDKKQYNDVKVGKKVKVRISLERELL